MVSRPRLKISKNKKLQYYIIIYVAHKTRIDINR